MWSAGRQVRFRIDHQTRELRFFEGLDASGERGIAQNENRRAVFAGDARGFDRDVETILDPFGSEDDARAVAMTAVDRLVQIALFDVGWEAGARAAALNVKDDERDLGHRGPADRFRLE